MFPQYAGAPGLLSDGPDKVGYLFLLPRRRLQNKNWARMSFLKLGQRRLHQNFPAPDNPDTVADAFDSLTTDRPEAPPQSAEDAIDQLQKQAGEAFDPAIVDTLASLLANGQMTAPELDAQFSSAAMGAR